VCVVAVCMESVNDEGELARGWSQCWKMQQNDVTKLLLASTRAPF
jgi:hypothetical protein